MDVDEFLEHHGVKGQQWGVRRQARLERKSAELNSRASDLLDRSDRLSAKADKIQNRRDNPPRFSAAKILGTAVGVAAIGAGAIYAHKLLSGSNSHIPVARITERVKKRDVSIVTNNEHFAIANNLKAVAEVKRQLERAASGR